MRWDKINAAYYLICSHSLRSITSHFCGKTCSGRPERSNRLHFGIWVWNVESISIKIIKSAFKMKFFSFALIEKHRVLEKNVNFSFIATDFKVMHMHS